MAGRARKAGRRQSRTNIWLIKAVVMALEIHIKHSSNPRSPRLVTEAVPPPLQTSRHIRWLGQLDYRLVSRWCYWHTGSPTGSPYSHTGCPPPGSEPTGSSWGSPAPRDLEARPVSPTVIQACVIQGEKRHLNARLSLRADRFGSITLSCKISCLAYARVYQLGTIRNSQTSPAGRCFPSTPTGPLNCWSGLLREIRAVLPI